MEGPILFFTYTLFAAQLLVIYWPAQLVVALGFVGMAVVARCYPEADFRRPCLWGSVQFLVPAAILLVGVLLRWEGPEDADPPQWPVQLLNALLWGHVPISVLLVISLNGSRWHVLAWSVAVFGYSLSAAAISSMSVTGNWL